jgi:hypothetical protein
LINDQLKMLICNDNDQYMIMLIDKINVL